MGNTGTATIDFGATGSIDTSVAVTGEASILSGSVAEAYFMADTTADHSDDEHVMASSMISLTCSTATAGVGFTIYAVAAGDVSIKGLVGQFTVRWVWV